MKISDDQPSTPRLIGRDNLIRQVIDDLNSTRVVVLSADVADPSTSSPGIGLTSCALGVMSRQSAQCDLTLRLRADSDIHFQADILATVRKYNLPERLVRRPDHPLIGLRQLIRRAKSPLILLDHVTSGDRIRELITSLPDVKFLLTSLTTLPPGVSEVKRVAVPALSEGDAVELLLNRISIRDENDDRSSRGTSVFDEPGPDAIRHDVEHRKSARRLVQLLNGNPAALVLVAETLRLTGGTLEQLPKLTEEIELLRSSVTAATPENSPLVRVARVLVNRLQQSPQLEPLLHQLLSLCVLDSEGVSGDFDPAPEMRQLFGWGGVGTKYDIEGSTASVPRNPESTGEFLPRQSISPGISHALLQAAPESLIVRAIEQGCLLWERARLRGGLPEEVALHGDALLRQTSHYQQFVRSRRPLVAVVRDLTLGIGACERAMTLGSEYVTLTREVSDDECLATALAHEGLARVQRAWNRVLLARRTFRQAIAVVEQVQPLPVAQWVRLECEVAESDLDECKVERANHHLLKIRDAVQTIRLEHPYLEARWSFLWAACCLAGRRPDKAAEILQDVLTWQQRKLGLDAYETLKTRALMARALFTQKKYAEAEVILRHDLQIRSESPAVPPSEEVVPTNFLAEMLFVQGRYAEAETLFQRVLEIRSETLGASHRLVGETSNRLAVLRGTRGDYKGAEPMFRRALAIAEEVYGETHPEVARVLNDLAEMLFAQGRYDQSRRLLERAQRIQERTLRKSDPKVSRTRSNLAAVYVAHGHYEAACKLYQDDVIAKQSEGQADDLRMATSLNNLGDVQRSIGKFVEAEHNLKGALLIRENVLGTQHPQVAQALNNLGYLYLNQYRLAEAEKTISRALEIRRATLSNEHPHVANALSTLAAVLFWSDRPQEAIPLLEEAEQITRAVFGEKHQQVAVVMSLLGRSELRSGHRARGELHLLKSRMIFEETVGQNHRLYADVLVGLGELSEAEGNDEQAFPYYERAVSIQRQTLNSPRLETAATLQALGCNLLRRNRLTAARERFEQALEIQQGIVTPDSPLLISPLIRHAEASLRAGDQTAAEQSLRHALKILDAVSSMPQKSLERQQSQLREDASLMLADLCIARRQFSEAGLTLSTLLDSPCTLPEPQRDARLLSVQTRIASLRVLEKQYAKAEPLQRECLAICQRLEGRQSPETAKRLESLSLTLAQLGRMEEADTLIQESIAICEHVYGDGHESVARALDQRAALLSRAKKTKEAAAVEARADALRGRESHVLDDIM